MKKIIFILLAISSFALASNLKGCIKTNIGKVESIFSCSTGDYRVVYENKKKEHVAEFIKIGEPAKIIQYINKK